MINIKRLLFILKKRSGYGVSYGLVNSAKFVCNALEDEGIQCKIVEVVDNNCIDREVFNYKPTHVMVEALWVVPDKFKVLLPRYPQVRWSVRIHSKIPFIGMEGIAMQWLWGYQNEIISQYDNFNISSNAYITTEELKSLGMNVIYLPNIYDPKIDASNDLPKDESCVDIGCFGSIRPLKNQLQQATAAIIFADNIKKKLRFHINSNRVEQHGDTILKNLENLFYNTKHELVKHDWLNHEDFLKLVSTMDLGLQVSFSETFNIVAADFVHQDIPLIGSPDIEWLNYFYKANPTDYQSIVEKLENAYKYRHLNLHWLNKYNLNQHNKKAVKIWLNYLNEEKTEE